MIDLNKEELLKIAQLSALQLDDDEVDAFAKDLRVLLDYTSELEQVSPKEIKITSTNVNVFRDDKAIAKDASLILETAPQTKDHYFVVPKILANVG